MRQRHIPRAFTHFLCALHFVRGVGVCTLRFLLFAPLQQQPWLKSWVVQEKTADMHNTFALSQQRIITRERRAPRSKITWALGKWFPLQVAPNWWIFLTLALERVRAAAILEAMVTLTSCHLQRPQWRCAWCLASLHCARHFCRLANARSLFMAILSLMRNLIAFKWMRCW